MISERDIVAESTEVVYAPQVVGNSFEAMPGYRVDRVFDDFWERTGFYAVGFSSDEADHAIVSIRGSQDRLDIVADGNLGVAQYNQNRDQLIDYIGANILGRRVTLCGHSLGGGLAQYLAYDASREFPAFRDKLTVHTHNGFGGITGICRMHGGYEPETIGGVSIRNYRHPADQVSRIGGQVGGRVFNLIAPDASEVDPLYAHANARFLPQKDKSLLEQVKEALDDAFDFAALDEVTPALTRALREIFTDRQPMQGATRIATLYGRLTGQERGVLHGVINDFLPVRRAWLKLWGNGKKKTGA